jgi:putative transposase
LVDTLGLVLAVKVVSGQLAEAAVAKRLFQAVRGKQERVEIVWADGGFANRIEAWSERECGWRVVVVKRDPAQKGWQLLPKRWIVERTYGWLGRYRSLSKEYDYLPQSSESRIYLAMTHRMLCRLTS